MIHQEFYKATRIPSTTRRRVHWVENTTFPYDQGNSNPMWLFSRQLLICCLDAQCWKRAGNWQDSIGNDILHKTRLSATELIEHHTSRSFKDPTDATAEDLCTRRLTPEARSLTCPIERIDQTQATRVDSQSSSTKSPQEIDEIEHDHSAHDNHKDTSNQEEQNY